MPHPEDCQTCPNLDNCPEKLSAQAFGEVYHGAKQILERVLDGSVGKQGLVTRATDSEQAHEVVRMAIRALLSVVVETMVEEGLPSHTVMMDLTFAMSKAIDPEEPHQ